MRKPRQILQLYSHSLETLMKGPPDVNKVGFPLDKDPANAEEEVPPNEEATTTGYEDPAVTGWRSCGCLGYQGTT